VLRSWEGAEPGSLPKLDNGNIPYHRHRAQFMNESWLGDREPFLFFASSNSLLSGSLNFSGSSVFFSMSLASYAKFMSLVKSAKFVSSRKATDSAVTAQGRATSWSLGGEKKFIV